ncbi:MAG: hypothetical protein JWP30_1255 [Homoserinimonas sp.]|jgi:hypothetical protein|nr:hypothetical protein [Homoserinimonas sp.]
MHNAPSSRHIADVLPGSWDIGATNLPLWLNGQRLEPVITYDVAATSPLVLTNEVSFSAPDGKIRRLHGHARWRRGHFLWRGARFLKPITSRWSVAGISEDANVVVLRYGKTWSVPEGVDVLVRQGADLPELRAIVANGSAALGLTAEDFATLTWMQGPEQQLPLGLA